MEFPQDNIQVWAVIRHICLGGPAWSWVSRYARQANGRDTYLALKGHYLGEAYISRMHTSADKTLETAFYDGRSRNFTYEKYCEILIQAFNDVKEAGEDVAEKRKMQMFLKGLNDPCYEAAKHTIRLTPNLRNSIANTMDLVAGVYGTLPASPIQRVPMCQCKSPCKCQPKVEEAAAEDAVAEGEEVAEEVMGGEVAPMPCPAMMKSSTATNHPMSGGTG